MPLMLTYVYGVVVLSLCRSRWDCGRSPPGDLGVVELENLTKRESCAATGLCPPLGPIGPAPASCLCDCELSKGRSSPWICVGSAPGATRHTSVPAGWCPGKVLPKVLWEQLVGTPFWEPCGLFCSLF